MNLLNRLIATDIKMKSIMNKKVLVVDDDPHIREVVTFALEKAGMAVLSGRDGKEGLELSLKQEPDLVVLDITMPEMDGLQMCRELRKFSEIPVLFLSSRDDEIDKIVGLEIGGDDYMTKPFSPRELTARVNVILKRSMKVLLHKQETQKEKPLLAHGKIKLDLYSHTAYWAEQQVTLTVTEFTLLQTFLTHPGRVYSRDNLISNSYELAEYVCDRTIDSHIRRIRGKFAQLGALSVIETVHGVGYKLGSCA